MAGNILTGQDIFDWALGLFGGGIALRMGFLAIRFFVRTRRSHGWPKVSGVVQPGEIVPPGSAGFIRSAAAQSRFGYSYSVNGQPYFGFFILVAEDMFSAEKLQKRFDGSALTVRYDPANPSISVLENKELGGRQIVQDPLWVDPA